MTAVEAPRLERYTECVTGFEASARNERANRAAGTTVRCRRCRSAVTPKVTPALRRWWLGRFSVEDIRQMACELWPNA